MNDVYEAWNPDIMYIFATHFQESDNEWISLDELLALFRDFTGKHWLSRPMFLSRYKPHTHFKKQIKHFRNKGGCRKDRVGYNIKQINPLSQIHVKTPTIVPCVEHHLTPDANPRQTN